MQATKWVGGWVSDGDRRRPLTAHRPPANLTPWRPWQVIDQGWTHYWGTSEWSREQVEEAWRVAERLDLIGPGGLHGGWAVGAVGAVDRYVVWDVCLWQPILLDGSGGRGGTCSWRHERGQCAGLHCLLPPLCILRRCVACPSPPPRRCRCAAMEQPQCVGLQRWARGSAVEGCTCGGGCALRCSHSWRRPHPAPYLMRPCPARAIRAYVSLCTFPTYPHALLHPAGTTCFTAGVLKRSMRHFMSSTVPGLPPGARWHQACSQVLWAGGGDLPLSLRLLQLLRWRLMPSLASWLPPPLLLLLGR